MPNIIVAMYGEADGDESDRLHDWTLVDEPAFDSDDVVAGQCKTFANLLGSRFSYRRHKYQVPAEPPRYSSLNIDKFIARNYC